MLASKNQQKFESFWNKNFNGKSYKKNIFLWNADLVKHFILMVDQCSFWNLWVVEFMVPSEQNFFVWVEWKHTKSLKALLIYNFHYPLILTKYF
jgi:hypothetical protein